MDTGCLSSITEEHVIEEQTNEQFCSFLSRSLGLKKEIEEFALLFLVFDENESWYQIPPIVTLKFFKKSKADSTSCFIIFKEFSGHLESRFAFLH